MRDQAQPLEEAGVEADFAAIMDGLEAEQEQGITIDVAYRYLATPRRTMILSDAPGHEQYTRNMATAASLADVAVLLVDITKGLVRQTRRHAMIASVMGVRTVIAAVNKMDLLEWSEAEFRTIDAQVRALLRNFQFAKVAVIPTCAKSGEGVSCAPAAGWWCGETVMQALDNAPGACAGDDAPLRFPVQGVVRFPDGRRAVTGLLTSGVMRTGQSVRVEPSGANAQIERVFTADSDLEEARAGASVGLVLRGDVDVGRGQVISDAQLPPSCNTQFVATVVWMQADPLMAGRQYLLKMGPQEVLASVTAVKHAYDLDNLSPKPARVLAMNDIGRCAFSVAAPLAFDPYAEHRATGGFILVDRYTSATAGAGLVLHGLNRGENLHPMAHSAGAEARRRIKGHAPAVIWLTGLSGSGKSTIADLAEQLLITQGVHAHVLDGDDLRLGLNRDLGFKPEDRVENIGRAGEVSKLLWQAGLVVLSSFISPYRIDRDLVRVLFPEGAFFEVYVDTPLDVCKSRDPKGLYAKALAGDLANFTGVSAPYEIPLQPDLHLQGYGCDATTQAERIVAMLKDHGVIA
jgi:bifunctional enzyme CysN/CysC